MWSFQKDTTNAIRSADALHSALMLGQTPIFAFLTFSKDVLYDTYFYAERIINLSPLEDQKDRRRFDETGKYGRIRRCSFFDLLPLVKTLFG